MKKILLAISVCALLASIPVLASCGHIHTLSDPTRDNEVAPTCRKAGSYDEVIYCTECEAELSRKKHEIARTPHNFVDNVCTECGFEETESTEGLTFVANAGGESYSLQRIGSCINEEELVIGTYNGLPVTRILYGALEGCKNIKKITLHDTVQEIEPYAFRDCSSLEEINLPDGIGIISYEAFKGCSSLKSITLPDSVYEISDGAFRGCSTLSNVTIPEGLFKLGTNAFTACDSFTSVTIPGNIAKIGDYAFSSCHALSEIIIDDGVAEIGAFSFFDCPEIKAVDLPFSISTIGNSAFLQCTGIETVTMQNNV